MSHSCLHQLLTEHSAGVLESPTVGGQRKAEIFAPFLFHTAGILHQLLHHVPVHQRLTAEVVHLQIGAPAVFFHHRRYDLIRCMIRVKRNDVMSYECQELQNAANDVDLTLEERDEAAEQLERLADAKDAHAQYIIGTAYRNGGLLILDTVKARKLLERAAAQEIDAAQYALGKLYLSDDADVHDPAKGIYRLKRSADNGMDRIERGEQRPPSVMLATTRLLYHMGNIFRDNAPIPAATGIQIDRKRLQELQRKRIALGHKPDDHELEPQGYTMQFH